MRLRFLAAALCALAAVSASAHDYRPANGQPCQSNERTIFESDGTTPFLCAPAGGPAYAFEVYTGDNLLWQGELRQDQTDVSHKLATDATAAKYRQPHLVFKRDPAAPPAINGVCLTEVYVAELKRFEVAGNVIHLPREEEHGMCGTIPAAAKEQEMHFGKFPGALVADNDYKLVVRLK